MKHANISIVMNKGMMTNHVHFRFRQFDETRVKPAVIYQKQEIVKYVRHWKDRQREPRADIERVNHPANRRRNDEHIQRQKNDSLETGQSTRSSVLVVRNRF